MEKKKSISELIESFDSFISKNRSSFSREEYCVLRKVRQKLLKVGSSRNKKSQRRAIIQTIVTELLKILVDAKIWNDIKNIF